MHFRISTRGGVICFWKEKKLKRRSTWPCFFLRFSDYVKKSQRARLTFCTESFQDLIHYLWSSSRKNEKPRTRQIPSELIALHILPFCECFAFFLAFLDILQNCLMLDNNVRFHLKNHLDDIFLKSTDVIYVSAVGIICTISFRL